VLTLTDTAQNAIRRILDAPEASHRGGLRIAPVEAGRLQLSVAEEPAPGDDVVERDGARVFLEPGAAAMLADSTLDAIVAESGTPSFFIAG